MDFTAMSDAEVVDWLEQKKGNTCGRFSQKQLERELVSVSASRNRWTWKTMTLALAVWLSSKSVEAEASNSTPISVTTQEQEEAQKEFSTQDSLLTLKGRVLDAKEQISLPGVTIQIKGTTIVTLTDADGYFSLRVPANLPHENPALIFSFIGYVPQERNLDKLLKAPDEPVLLNLDAQALGESVIVGGYHAKWYSPRSMFYKLRTLFRN
ncbi:carboxypeptidase-like regulatory domain-containing protein [Rufibacter latericius]|nr:carboxypeptidase-like regulatory domain-containing protein [Rufibacter latericius]